MRLSIRTNTGRGIGHNNQNPPHAPENFLKKYIMLTDLSMFSAEKV